MAWDQIGQKYHWMSIDQFVSIDQLRFIYTSRYIYIYRSIDYCMSNVIRPLAVYGSFYDNRSIPIYIYIGRYMFDLNRDLRI